MMGGMKAGSVNVEIAADVTKLQKGLAKASSSLTKFSQKASKAGKTMSLKVTAPLLGAGAGAFKAAMDFEESMTKIVSLVGLSSEAVKGFEADVKRLAGETGRAPKELADAMFFITSAGLRGATALEALEASAKAAAIGMGETEIVADAVTNAINGYGEANISAAEATDILVKTVEQGKAAASDLAPQFGRLVPMAAELGVEFHEVGGALAFLTRSSGDAAMSTSQFSGILRAMIKPSQAAKEILSDIGFSVAELRTSIADDGILPALMDLREMLEANGLQMSDVIEDSRGFTGALQLTGVQAGIAADVFKELAGSTGKLDEAFAVAEQTTRVKFNQAMSQIKIMMVDLGDDVVPMLLGAIQALVGAIRAMSDWFQGLSPNIQKLVISLAGLAAAIGPLLMLVGSMAAGVAALGTALGVAAGGFVAVLGPLALVVAAVGGALYLCS